MVEHLVYTERVGGSSPSPPTTGTAEKRDFLDLKCLGQSMPLVWVSAMYPGLSIAEIGRAHV